MPQSTFDDFVRREEQAAKSEHKVNWEEDKQRWLKSLRDLHKQIDGFLESYISAGQVTVRFDLVEITEEYIGSYKAPRMYIVIGRKTIMLQPIGTLLIGSRGRVDVVGPSGQGQLSLLSENVKRLSDLITVTVSLDGKLPSSPPAKKASEISWVWRILGRPPARNITELTRENFLNMLTEISNG